MIRSQNRTILALVGFIVIAGVILLATSVHKQPTPKPNAVTAGKQDERVNLTNQPLLKPYVDDQGVTSVEQSLYAKIKLSNPSVAKRYDGMVRDWSFRIFTENESTVTTFMVDVPSLQQSYLVSVSGDNNSDYNAVYVACPKANQVIYPPFSCTDAEA